MLRIMVFMEYRLAYSRDVLAGVAQYAREHPAWNLSLANHADQAWGTLAEADGIVGYFDSPQLAAAIADRGLPAVTVASCRQFVGCASLHSDERAVGALAADHFLQRGFSHFAQVGLSRAPFGPIRQAGFARPLASARPDTPIPTLNTHTAADTEDQRRLDFLAGLPVPCGVFCLTDWVAHRVSLAARRIGRRIPEELAIVGVDNDLMICDFTDPPLSSVRQATDRIGYEACELLAKMLAGQPTPTDPVLVPPRGVVPRRSSDILAVADPMVRLAVEIIHSKPGGQVGVSEVFAGVPLSRRMLEMRFKAAMGRTVRDEVWRRRVERVRYLLEETDQPFKQIAEAAGFAHTSYLTTFFKKLTGLTPSQCRAAVRLESRRPGPL